MPAAPDSKAFAGKFLEKLGKISRQEIETFLSRLLLEKSFFETILDNLLEGVIVTDPDGRLIFVNQAARRILSLRRNRSVVGDAFVDHLASVELRSFFLSYDPSSDETRTGEIAVGEPGRERILGIALMPIREESGDLMCLVALAQDLTGRKREEERRIQSQRLDSLATLTAGVAHEIKNPLNSMSLHAHLLKKALARIAGGKPPSDLERVSRSSEILIEEIDRLTRVVEEFLTAVRPTRPQFEMRNVNDILRRLAVLMEAEVARRQIQVEMELDSEIPPSRVDELQLSLAFRNLIKNSMEAIEHDHGWIFIRSSLGPDAIAIEFRDNGPGIPPDQVKRIFEPYVTTKFHGAGLGLMTVYRIVHEHGGRIQVNAEPGQGANIRITLPSGPRPTPLLPEHTSDVRTVAEGDA